MKNEKNVSKFPYESLSKTFQIIATSLNQGINLIDSIKQGIGASNNEVLNRSLKEMIDSYNTKGTITPPMRKHNEIFPRVFVQITKAGFDSGSLDKVWAEAANTYKKMAKENK
jgi:type II secretory pathway component PulF